MANNMTKEEESLWLNKLKSFKKKPNDLLFNELAQLIVEPDYQDFYNTKVFPLLKQYFRQKLENLKQNSNDQSLIDELTEMGVDEFYDIKKIENPRLEPNIIFEHPEWIRFYQKEIAPSLRQFFWVNKYEKFREDPTDILFFQLKKLGDFIDELKSYQSEQWVNFYDNRVIPLLTRFAETKDRRLMIREYRRTGVINPFLEHLLNEINSHKTKSFQEIVLLNDFDIAKRDRKESEELIYMHNYTRNPHLSDEEKQKLIIRNKTGIVPPEASLIKRKFKFIESNLRRPNPWYKNNCLYISAWDLGYITEETKFDFESTESGPQSPVVEKMYRFILSRYKPGYIVSIISGFTLKNINSVLDMYLGINEFTMLSFVRQYAELNESIFGFTRRLNMYQYNKLKPETQAKYNIIQNAHAITVYKNELGEIRYLDRHSYNPTGIITDSEFPGGITYQQFLEEEGYIYYLWLYFMIPDPNYPRGFLPTNEAFSPIRKKKRSLKKRSPKKISSCKRKSPKKMSCKRKSLKKRSPKKISSCKRKSPKRKSPSSKKKY